MTLTTAVPYESSVGIKSILIGYCSVCRLVDPIYGWGGYCDCEPPRKFRKRRMWPCVVCDHYYLTYKDLLEHEHEDYI